MKSFLTIDQLKNRIQQLNNLIAKFPRVRSLVRKWGFELTVLEGKVEALEARKPEAPKQLTIWDVPMTYQIISKNTFHIKDQLKSWGCKWDSIKKAWVAPDELIYNQAISELEKYEGSVSVQKNYYGQCGFDHISNEDIDNFLNDKIEAQPQQTQPINYTPTMGDALKLFGEEQVNRYWDGQIPFEASKILASGETNETEIFDRLSYEGMKGKSVDMLIDLVNHFRQNPPTKSKYIELVSYRSKGINAYLCPVVNSKADYTQADYGKPINEAEQEKAHRSKKHTVKIRYDNLPDGLYQWKEAGGADNNKARYGWMKIIKGECVAEGEGYPPRS